MDAIGQMVHASGQAYRAYRACSLKDREKAIDAIRTGMKGSVMNLAEMSFKETGMGHPVDKARKIKLAVGKTPGIEDLGTEVLTNDDGMVLTEYASYGIVAAVHPCTNPIAVLVNATISALAAGNAIIHCPHPRAYKCSQLAVDLMNKSVRDCIGIDHLVAVLPSAGHRITEELMNHPDVDMILVTGSDTALSAAFRADKKVVGAGPANPPVIVDETADLDRAAADIAKSAGFDYNLMCVSEKAIVAIDRIAEPLLTAFARQGVQVLNQEDMEKVEALLTNADGDINHKFEGRPLEEILKQAGVQYRYPAKLAVGEAQLNNLIVMKEIKVPVVPMVRMPDFKSALKAALQIEQHNRHTAGIHSRSIERLEEAARVMGTSVFVKNAPFISAAGFDVDVPCALSIANRTGEGPVSARHLAFRRRCVLAKGFQLR
ncbi:MAG: aldehyde dehydrogenase [Pseudoramibacter sp.]|jgi:propionaldehyde dehydrogenase|nr:aldehyde dehydrogenase [Pseudoramibacter sp.]MCH4105761.1 aldehyde dehydrogenase [Pseudoramibacter sp.]